jgi:hypothetical protein
LAGRLDRNSNPQLSSRIFEKAIHCSMSSPPLRQETWSMKWTRRREMLVGKGAAVIQIMFDSLAVLYRSYYRGLGTPTAQAA